MKSLILVTVVAILHLSSALMTVKDFELSRLSRCYDTNMQDSRRVSDRNINGQVLPLPNSMETFISIVERYESLNPNVQVRELVEKLLRNFRIDDLHPDVIDEIKLRDTSSSLHNRMKRLLLSVPEISYQYTFNEDDFTDDEKCALHFMLSHTVNDTSTGSNDLLVDNTNKVKEPREFGVVNLHSKRKHAFALGRVLLGINAAYMNSPGVDISTILQKEGKTDVTELRGIKVNPVYAVTVSDLITRLVAKSEVKVLPNGEWNDISCPTYYKLEENEGGFVTYSELRGGVDGLLIGKRIQESSQDYVNFRLSQILRMYYGYSGMLDTTRTRWCNRINHLQGVTDLEGDILNYFKLYKALSDGGSAGQSTPEKIQNTMSYLRDDSFNNVEKDECNIQETSIDRRYTSPRNVFAILDYSSSGQTKLNLQAEIIGNLSADFDLRPRGNLMGLFSNMKPLQQNTLDVIAKNSGTAGCPSCFAKYYRKAGTRQDEAELFKDLNSTLTNFDEEQQKLEEQYQSEMKAGSPGKIILYFNFGSSNPDYKVREALWELKRSFGGATILAIGDNRDALNNYVENDQLDVLTISPKIIQELKQRIYKIPAEYTYRECNHSTPSREADNKQEAFIGYNKIQYWAMYPQYFLKSYGLRLKFKSQEGGQVRVCFSRSYSNIIDKTDNCKDSAGGEIEFFVKDPCKSRNVYNCDPFYFSVEGRKAPATQCQSLRCSSVSDIQFQFEHEGISCNIANYISVSSLALLLAAVMFYHQRQ